MSYVPFKPGEYAVHVLCDEEDIQGSPWMSTVVEANGEFDPSKVNVLSTFFFDTMRLMLGPILSVFYLVLTALSSYLSCEYKFSARRFFDGS